MKKVLIRMAIKAAIVGLLIFILFAFIIQIRVVHTNDMYPNVKDGQLCVVSQITDPILDKIVLYKDRDGIEHFGRVIAQGGDTVEIKSNSIIINDNVLYQTIPFEIVEGELEYPYPVPEDSLFLMNDYREQENDSRIYGGIPREEIIGVLIFTMQYRGF